MSLIQNHKVIIEKNTINCFIQARTNAIDGADVNLKWYCKISIF